MGSREAAGSNPVAPTNIKVVIGPRRAGKSFFAMHLVRGLGPFGYVNLDDERLEALGDYGELVAALDALYGKPRHLLLDEVQNLPKWELFVMGGLGFSREGYTWRAHGRFLLRKWVSGRSWWAF